MTPATGIAVHGALDGAPGRTARRMGALRRAGILTLAAAALAATGLPAWAAAATSPAATTADTPAPPRHYRPLATSKALAMVAGSPEAGSGVSHGRSNDLAAATEALAACSALNGIDAPCELRWLNDEPITTGAEIRARLPETPHPLFLWHYRSPAASVHLAGSVHVLKRTLHPLPAQYEAAFRAADHIAVEVDLTRYDPAELAQRTLAHAALPAGTTLANVVPAQLMTRLEPALHRYGLAYSMVEHAEPALVTQQLVLARLLALGYDAAHGLEQYYLDRRGDRTVLELETLEDQLALLFDQPMPTQIDMLADALALADSIEPILADLLAAWLGGDDAAFLQAFDAQGDPSAHLAAFRRAVLDDRNETMATGVETLLHTPGNHFVLVGAAHLIGDSGIVARLAERGIEGRRIDSDDPL